MEESLVELRSKINVSCRSTVTTLRRTMFERSSSSLLSAAVEAPCRQSDNYRRENGAAKVPFSLIVPVPALCDHLSNRSDLSTIAGNCDNSINNYRSISHDGTKTLNLPTNIATRKSSKSTVDTARSILSTKIIKTRLPAVKPAGGVKRTDETIMHEAMMVELSAATTTTSTTYNEFNNYENNYKASDHDPNNVVECRIPLVNANNECSRATTIVTPMISAEVASRLKVIDMATPSRNLPRKNRCNDVEDNYCCAGKMRNRNASGFSGGKSAWWQLVVAIYTLMLYISSTSVCWAARQEVISNCTFPQRWEGTWFLSGYQQSVHIRGSQFSYRGKCVASDGNKYLIVNDECHRCLVIYEKHKNVLQFKESECEGDNMYGDQSNPNAMAMRSVVKSDHRGGAHPNLNGHPRLTSSDQYIMRSNDDSNDCSFCKRRETLQNLCDQIPGDALLYSLFRENAEPVKCPLKGPFSFTYNRGHGECKSPVSNIESCTEESRLLLSFQACPDVQGTESTVEELTCLATWKDGNSRYLIGLVSQHHTHHLAAPHHALSNEERYRCFVYEKISTMMGPMSNLNIKDAEYKLAQSGDATCNGLDSAEVGSRMMTLRKPPPAERCDFPAWFKAPRHWRALMGNIGYTFHQSDGSMHITSNGALETRALCEQINKQTQTEMMAVVHYTRQCESGFMCMTFYKRDMQVAEIQMGTPASRLEDACAPDHFDLNKPFITLLASSPESQLCPLEGLFSLRGAIGPPYITSRHKRNHNNKGHNQHGHHHHEQGHKRHGIQSFRNSEEFGQTSWQSHTRGLSIRSRRAAAASAGAPTISSVDHSGVAGAGSMGGSDIDSIRDKSKVFNSRQYRNALPSVTESETAGNVASNVLYEASDDVGGSGNTRRITITQTVDGVGDTTQQRNRRDAPACMVNYKAQRQLLVGCTDTNLIEVRPRCSEDGEESYLCHGSWSENSTVYIVAKNQATQHGVCISYKQLDGNDGLLVVGDSCYRGLQKPPDHHFVANLTLAGKCGDTSSTYSIHYSKRNWIQLRTSTTTTTTTTLLSMAVAFSILLFSTR